MSSETFPHFQNLLTNERSFDRLFCDVSNGSRFDLYFNDRFKDDPVFNHAVIDDSILSSTTDIDDITASMLFHEIKTEATRHHVPPTVFVEEFWAKSRFVQKAAVQEGYIVGGSMEVLSKIIGAQSNFASDAFVLESDDPKLWNQVFMSSYAIPPVWEEELIRREQMFSRSDSTRLLLAWDAQKKPVGCMLTHLTPPHYLGIYCVGTVPEMRHRGVASAMLHKAETMAITCGCKYLTLQTISSDGVTPMYLKSGFRLEFRRNVLLFP